MTVFKGDEIVQVRRRWKAGHLLLQLTCAVMHEPLRFWLLLVRSAFQADAEDQVYSSQPGWHLLLRKAWERWEGAERAGTQSEASHHHGGVKDEKHLPQAGAAFGLSSQTPTAKELHSPTVPQGSHSSHSWGRREKWPCSPENIFFTAEWRGKKTTPSILGNFLLSVRIW